MSSTNRGAERQEHDYYITNPDDICQFLEAWARDEEHGPEGEIERVLDPCAGGNIEAVDWVFKRNDDGTPKKIYHIPPTPMSYPTALERTFDGLKIVTNDIREDSPAGYCGDFQTLRERNLSLVKNPADLDITNPPFSLAVQSILAGLECVRHGGYVVRLLRLNFLESKQRRSLFHVEPGAVVHEKLDIANPPAVGYVHPERLSFLPDGATDSIAYAHFIWRHGYKARWTAMKVL